MAKPRSRATRPAAKTSPRASRRTKTTVSYREVSTGSDPEESDAEPESDSDEPKAKKPANKRPSRPRAAARSKRRRTATCSPAPPFSSPTQRERKTVRKRITDGDERLGNTVSVPLHEFQESEQPGKIPDWASLPYHILVQIFHYASYPLFDERTFQPLGSAGGLAILARMCRSFSEAAVTVLYHNPPLIPMERAHQLRQLLVADAQPMAYNYRAKVKQLQMEVSQTAAYSLPGSGLLDFFGIIYNCPQLLDLELYHQRDMFPYRDLDTTIKWSYPDSIFYALEKNVTGSPTRLRSWRWNSRLGGKRRSLDKLLKIHETQPFSELRKLAFVNYQKSKARKNVEGPENETMLAESLRVLTKLEHLILESSTLANKLLLSLLPGNLRHLELINCRELESEDLATFLLSRGGQLRSLLLDHNQSLGLSFLTVLGRACPHLETLKMHHSYHFGRLKFCDSQPKQHKTIDKNEVPKRPLLVGANEVPEWPSSLRTIELKHLKFWDVETSEIFFSSLLLNAGNLVNLRRLVIKAILDTQNWRERSSIRETWVRAFERKFKRPFVPPNPYLRSIDGYKAFRQTLDDPPGERSWKTQVDHTLEQNSACHDMDQPQASVQSGDSKNNKVALQSDGRVTRRSTRRSTRLIPVKASTGAQHSQTQSGDDSEFSNEHSGGGYSSSQQSAGKKAISRVLDTPRERARTHRSLRFTLRATAEDGTENSESSNFDFDRDASSSHRTKQQKLALEGNSIQGKCDVVSIMIDNLRPSEKQFVEADFLDSEPEGDEDWDGTEDEEGDEGGGYAW